MKSHGIILRDWEARAIIEGRKTQMRFVLKPQPHPFVWKYEQLKDGLWQGYERDSDRNRPRGEAVKMPYSVGDQLWGRETWCRKVDDEGFSVYNDEGNLDSTCCHYAADGVDVIKVDGDGGIKYRSNGAEASPWSSSVTMPRWASRILLEVTQVRVQRVQEITEEDAIAEGVERIAGNRWLDYGGKLPSGLLSARMSFFTAFNSIHGPGAWERNDWVWAVTFKRLEGGAS